MQKWYHIIPKNTGLSIYAWIIFCILPFYFIFRTSGTWEIIFGVFMILLFFTAYRVSFLSKGWTVYLSVSTEMVISIVMTLFLGYVYFALFLAFYIGNIQHKSRFITLYVIHLTTTIVAVSAGFFIQNEIFRTQLPFIIISVIGVILLPITIYFRNKRERLENQLKDANQKLSQLVVLEERQRIARDLHDTLGQKLSLIGLKSDLAGKLVSVEPDLAKNEINDIHQTARTALKEVREMVSDMKGAKLNDELIRVEQVLKAAQIDFHLEGNTELTKTPLLVENVLSMCLKEAVTNIVKHSQATFCNVTITQSPNEVLIKVEDNGIGISNKKDSYKENGLQGMKERLEFVNGSLDIESNNGTTLKIQVPKVVKQTE
ncbi:two-component system, NarL family, sensor histidine kinase DesK [Virgibacillus subterraneus]|uniref:histidine kinase n=1 Tax=Virgibacillus subterraneus TaxID=621109 RepID=A0A1H8ZHL0_9BACI|nr:sensor histidine kinase [Virgibacillus subterraneus]SEP63841.1 two-component system, NarL family, sensor histidine kinase DesK [Virgibacillus subterraneus]